jgi:hypothetical protein
LHEGILDFFAAVDGCNEDEQGAASNEEAEGSGGSVAFIVW